MRLFLLWRRFVRLLRSIGLAMGRGKPVDWATKIDEATELASDYLDIKDCPPSETTAEQPKEPTRPLKGRLRRGKGRRR